MEDKQGEVYAGPLKEDNVIDITVESASGPTTGDSEGEIIETVKTVETTTTRHSKHPRKSAKAANAEPKKKKTGVIVAAVLIVFLLFGCIGGGGSDNTTDTNSNSTATETTTAENTDSNEQETTETVDEYYSWTSEQQHAYNSGLSYLDYTAFSKQGLIDQLSSEYGEGYPVEVAEFAVNKIEERGEVDWVEQAKRSAQSYLNLTDFSKQGLIDQLSSPYGEQFTVEQATEAVEAVY